MVKVLIYSSKEIFDKSSYEGRAEAHIIAYRKDDGYYEVVKNRTKYRTSSYSTYESLRNIIQWVENNQWELERAIEKDKEIAEVAQRQSHSLPTRRSRVQIPSSAPNMSL